MGEERAYKVMVTAHRRGACVLAVYTRDVAETKSTEATEAGRAAGYPMLFNTGPEESGSRPRPPAPRRIGRHAPTPPPSAPSGSLPLTCAPPRGRRRHTTNCGRAARGGGSWHERH